MGPGRGALDGREGMEAQQGRTGGDGRASAREGKRGDREKKHPLFRNV